MIDKFNVDTMFAAIQSSLGKPEKQTNIDYSNILKFEIGKTYRLRLLPFVGDPSKTFQHYIEYGWTSKATENYISVISPSMWGEPCPVDAFWRTKYNKATNTNTSGIRRREQWMVNAYVIDDPSHPENNGKIKVLRYGKQLDHIISDAVTGDLSAEIGKLAFDLSPEGYDLIVRCEKQQDYPNYTHSSFARKPSEIPGIGNDRAKIENIYQSVFDLSTLCKVKSYDALKKILDEHYFVKSDIDSQPVTIQETQPTSVIESTPVSTVEPINESSNNDNNTISTDDDLDKLIADL